MDPFLVQTPTKLTGVTLLEIPLIASIDTIVETVEHIPIGKSIYEVSIDEEPKAMKKFPYDDCLRKVDEVRGDIEVSTVDEVP